MSDSHGITHATWSDWLLRVGCVLVRDRFGAVMRPMIRHSARALVLVVCFTATIPGGGSIHAQEEAPDLAIAEATPSTRAGADE